MENVRGQRRLDTPKIADSCTYMEICIARIMDSLRLRALVLLGDGFMGDYSAIAAMGHLGSHFSFEKIFRTVTAPTLA